MAKNKPMDAMTKIVEILTPLPSEERTRVVRAAMVMLGETQSPLAPSTDLKSGSEDIGGGQINLPPRARAWMKQNYITEDDLQQVFHVTESGADVIAAHIPGKKKKGQTYNAYILTGIAQMLATGNPIFQDKAARALCESSGCYDNANHSAHIKGRGNEFTGTKEKGWTLTAPGLKHGAELIKELNKKVE
jgi:hypothetical protein